MLPLQFHVSFRCLYLVGAVLSDPATGKAWEAGEPSFVDCIEPSGDWWGTHCHVIEVDELWNRLDGDTVCLVVWLLMDSLGVPPLKFAWVGASSNVNHVKFISFVKSTMWNRFTVC